MPDRVGVQPSNRQATDEDAPAAGSCGSAETSIDATGNISRGIAIFCTSALLRTIERVPALKVSVKKWTMTRPAEQVDREVLDVLVQAEDDAEDEVVDARTATAG